MPVSGPMSDVTIASSSQQPNANSRAPPSKKHQVAQTVTLPNNQHLKSLHLNSLIKFHRHRRPKNIHNQSLILPNLQIDLVLWTLIPLFPSDSNPISIYQSQLQIHQAQTQQQRQFNTQCFLLYSDFLTKATTTISALLRFSYKYNYNTMRLQYQISPIPDQPRALQPELLNYSNTPQFLTQTFSFINTDKTGTSELPQPFHTVSTIEVAPQDISLISISDTSKFDPLVSKFSLPTPS